MYMYAPGTWYCSITNDTCTCRWILETAGRHWVAKRINCGSHNISNGLTIRKSFDLCSSNLKRYAIEHKLWTGKGELDFAECFSDGMLDCNVKGSRLVCGAAIMKKKSGDECRGGGGSLDAEAMMEILRDHDGGICMHGGFETTAAMVSELKRDGDEGGRGRNSERVVAQHWMTGRPHPCKSPFLLQRFT
mmetsp:Transcript_8751/g.17878  ORF Transcript_8751/g.17878 Transcript_8751/m.17878 type:complete len:190 (-) Transcript_8751:310-879(-)